jgi:hypothetical protein
MSNGWDMVLDLESDPGFSGQDLDPTWPGLKVPNPTGWGSTTMHSCYRGNSGETLGY